MDTKHLACLPIDGRPLIFGLWHGIALPHSSGGIPCLVHRFPFRKHPDYQAIHSFPRTLKGAS